MKRFLFTPNPKAPLKFHWLKQNHPGQVQLSKNHVCRLYTKHRGTQPLQLSKSNMHSCSSIGYLERSMSQATVEVILFGATWASVSYIQTESFPQNSKDWVENFETLILTKKTVFRVLLAAAWVCGKPRGRGNWKKGQMTRLTSEDSAATDDDKKEFSDSISSLPLSPRSLPIP